MHVVERTEAEDGLADNALIMAELHRIMAKQNAPVGWFLGGYFGAQIGYCVGSLIGHAVDPLAISAPSPGA